MNFIPYYTSVVSFFTPLCAIPSDLESKPDFLLKTREGDEEFLTADMNINPSSAEGFDKFVSEGNVKKVIFCRGAEFILENSEGSDCLKSLDLRQLRVDDRLLAIIADKFPNLTGLTLGNIDALADNQLSDEGVSSIIRCKYLKVLALNGFPKITDVSMDALKHLRKTLRELSLEFCQGITDNATESFQTFSRLEYLSLNGCRNISQESVQRLEDKLEKLSVIAWPSG